MIADTEIDWSGVAPESDRIEPLTPETFVRRLRALGQANIAIDRLRRAMSGRYEEASGSAGSLGGSPEAGGGEGRSAGQPPGAAEDAQRLPHVHPGARAERP